MLRLDPRNSQALGGISVLDAISGQWTPRSCTPGRPSGWIRCRASGPCGWGSALRKLGRYQEARAELDRALARTPAILSLIEARVMVELREGNLDSARAVLRTAATQVDPAALAAYTGNYWDLFWVLDDPGQQLLLTLTPADFDADHPTWAIVRAQTFWVRGDKVRTKAYADTARMGLLEQLKFAPADPQRLLFLGLAEAYIGQKAEAIRNAERGAAMLLPSQDAISGAYFQHVLTRVYILTGEYDKALDHLEPLLKMPYDLSPAWLRIDPNFAPLKGNPVSRS